jgi:hypothetical protein
MPDEHDERLSRRMIKRLGEPARYVRDSPLFNAVGLQVARILWVEARHRLRPRLLGPSSQQLAELDERGIVIIENFLPQEDFAQLLAHVMQMRAEGRMQSVVNEFGTGLTCTRAAISSDIDAGRWLAQHVAGHPLLQSLVQSVTRRRVSRPPRLIYQHLHLPPCRVHHDDAESVLHADRHYPTVKAYLSLAPIKQHNGAYIWCDGTHRLTPARLRYEYEFSRLRGDGSCQAIRAARMVALERTQESLDLRQTVIETEANTLVLSNNRGFHCRGNLAPGTVREQLRMTFHYLHEPYYVTQAWTALRWLDSRGRIPRRQSAWLRRAGYL